jgi:ion channel
MLPLNEGAFVVAGWEVSAGPRWVEVLEVLVWALAYAIVDAAPAGADLVYFALVNYTTLGYGDVIPMARWRLLGPMTAMNGVLLFGWSTAVIFQVLRRTMLLDARGT